MLKVGILMLIFAIGVYIIAATCDNVKLSVGIAQYLNLIHLASLYIAMAIYVMNSVKRIPFGTVSCMTLLLLSSYTGIIVEIWRFEGVYKSVIPPFLFILTCAERYQALCDHFSAYEISVPMITAFVVLCWSLHIILASIKKRGNQVETLNVENASEVNSRPVPETH